MRAQQTPSDPLIGRVLAERYEVEERLGEGGMGVVYRARHVVVGRPFAVKVLHERALMDDKVARRFVREAELAGRLRHPNLVGVVDVGEVDGRRYMVMELAEGPDLATLLEDAPMRPERIIRIVRQLLEGLYHAHELGLIHRDLKPENVIVERDTHGDEVARIVDFGIALLRDADASDTQDRLTTGGLVLGTPHYMAPEQAVADPIDHRIDLFALGIVVYEMLSGRLPFDGRGAEVARANLLLDPPPIAQRVEHLEVDPLLEAFARQLMAKRRDDRPATAKAARELLDLIERDRVAAVGVLGLPLTASHRAGPTEEVPPIEIGAASSGDPALEDVDPTTKMRPTPRGHAPEAVLGKPESTALPRVSFGGGAASAVRSALAAAADGPQGAPAVQAARVAPAIAVGGPVALPSALPRPPAPVTRDLAPGSIDRAAAPGSPEESRHVRIRAGWWIGGAGLGAAAALAALALLRGGAGDIGEAPASADTAGRTAKISEARGEARGDDRGDDRGEARGDDRGEARATPARAQSVDPGRAGSAAVAGRDPAPPTERVAPAVPARPPAGSGNRVTEHSRSPRGTAISAADRAVAAPAVNRGAQSAPRDSVDRDAHRGSLPVTAARAPASADSSPAGLRALFEVAWAEVGKLSRADGDDLTARLLRFQISQAMQAAPDERTRAAAQLSEIVQEARRRGATSTP